MSVQDQMEEECVLDDDSRVETRETVPAVLPRYLQQVIKDIYDEPRFKQTKLLLEVDEQNLRKSYLSLQHEDLTEDLICIGDYPQKTTVTRPDSRTLDFTFCHLATVLDELIASKKILTRSKYRGLIPPMVTDGCPLVSLGTDRLFDIFQAMNWDDHIDHTVYDTRDTHGAFASSEEAGAICGFYYQQKRQKNPKLTVPKVLEKALGRKKSNDRLMLSSTCKFIRILFWEKIIRMSHSTIFLKNICTESLERFVCLKKHIPRIGLFGVPHSNLLFPPRFAYDISTSTPPLGGAIIPQPAQNLFFIEGELGHASHVELVMLTLDEEIWTKILFWENRKTPFNAQLILWNCNYMSNGNLVAIDNLETFFYKFLRAGPERNHRINELRSKIKICSFSKLIRHKLKSIWSGTVVPEIFAYEPVWEHAQEFIDPWNTWNTDAEFESDTQIALLASQDSLREEEEQTIHEVELISLGIDPTMDEETRTSQQQSSIDKMDSLGILSTDKDTIEDVKHILGDVTLLQNQNTYNFRKRKQEQELRRSGENSTGRLRQVLRSDEAPEERPPRGFYRNPSRDQNVPIWKHPLVEVPIWRHPLVVAYDSVSPTSTVAKDHKTNESEIPVSNLENGQK